MLLGNLKIILELKGPVIFISSPSLKSCLISKFKFCLLIATFSLDKITDVKASMAL